MLRDAEAGTDTRTWIELSGRWIDIAPFGNNNFVALSVDGHVYTRIAGELKQLEGVLRGITSTPDGKCWWGFNQCGQLYTCQGDGIWENVCNDKLRVKSILYMHEATASGFEGQNLFVLTEHKHVWRFSLDSGHWTQITTLAPLIFAACLFPMADTQKDQTSRLCFANSDRRAWAVVHTDCVSSSSAGSDIETGCIVNDPSTPGHRSSLVVDSQHRIVCIHPTGTPQGASYPPEAPRAKLLRAHLDAVYAITDAGALFWSPGSQ